MTMPPPDSHPCCGGAAPLPDAKTTRQAVSAAYEQAIGRATRGASQGCCSTPATTAAELAGYGLAEGELPDGVAQQSFGCGNPLAFAEVQSGETVLDLGSGAGLDLILAARAVGPGGRVIGVDMTDAMLERARANVEAAGLAGVVDLRRGIIEALPVADASVDHVVSNCVINLSPEKDRVFAEIARVLRPGGRMLISDIVLEGGIPEPLQGLTELYFGCVAGAISESAYLDGLRAAGLTQLEVRGRHVYEAEELLALTGTVLEALPPELVALGTSMVGRVASLSIHAVKPD